MVDTAKDNFLAVVMFTSGTGAEHHRYVYKNCHYKDGNLHLTCGQCSQPSTWHVAGDEHMCDDCAFTTFFLLSLEGSLLEVIP